MNERDVFTQLGRSRTLPHGRHTWTPRAPRTRLRERVEVLLRGHDRPDSLLDAPFAVPPGPTRTYDRAPSDAGVTRTQAPTDPDGIGAPPPGGRLFNGKDLTGWGPSRGKGRWGVADGCIVTEGEAWAEGWLPFDKPFSAYELKLEYRIDPGGNCGVNPRVPAAPPAADPQVIVAGGGMVEIQLLDDAHPKYAAWRPVQKKTGALNDLVAPKALADAPPGAWNRLELRVTGDRVLVRVNGTVVQDTAVAPLLAAGRPPGSGRVALQRHTGRAAFRDIYVRELPSESRPPAVAPFTAAQAKAYQEAWARHLGIPVEFENSIGMKLRLVPAGEFTMGTTAEQFRRLQTSADVDPYSPGEYSR